MIITIADHYIHKQDACFLWTRGSLVASLTVPAEGQMLGFINDKICTFITFVCGRPYHPNKVQKCAEICFHQIRQCEYL